MSHSQILLLLSLDNSGHISKLQRDAGYSGKVSSQSRFLVLIILKRGYLFCIPCAVRGGLAHFVKCERYKRLNIQKSSQIQ